MLTVLHVLEALGAGCARHVTDLVTHVDGVRHVVVVPPRRPGDLTDPEAAARMAAAGARVHVVDMRRLPVHRHNATALLAIRRIICAEQPDVVHGHASIGGALARLASVGRGVAVVWTPNGVLTARPAVAVERLLGRMTDTVVAVSPSEDALLVRLRIARPGQVVVIRNGIETQPAADGTNLRAMLGIPATARVVGMLGRLVPQKAPLDFVEAARQVARVRPDVHFVLIGDGPLRGAVDSAVAAGDFAGRFHRIPVLPRAGRVLGQLDVFLLTSRYEGGPYAPLEAMREGVPVVLTDVVGSADLVSHGETGLLTPAGNPDKAAEEVISLLSGEDSGHLMAKRARELLVTRYDVRRMGQKHRLLYEGLAQGHGTAGEPGHRARLRARPRPTR